MLFNEFKFIKKLEQSHYLECPNCHYIHKGLTMMDPSSICKCGVKDVPILFPPGYRLTSVYDNIVLSYYKVHIQNMEKENKVNRYLIQKFPNMTGEEIGQVIEHITHTGNHFIIAKDLDLYCNGDMKEALIESAAVMNIMSNPGIESSFIIIQTMTLFEMWLSLLIRRVLESKGTDANVITYLLDGMRAPDRYLGFIKDCSSIEKKEILEPIFTKNSISYVNIEKTRNDNVHRGIFVYDLDTVRKAVTVASCFLPTFVDIFNKHLVQPVP